MRTVCTMSRPTQHGPTRSSARTRSLQRRTHSSERCTTSYRTGPCSRPRRFFVAFAALKIHSTSCVMSPLPTCSWLRRLPLKSTHTVRIFKAVLPTGTMPLDSAHSSMILFTTVSEDDQMHAFSEDASCWPTYLARLVQHCHPPNLPYHTRNIE